MTADHAPHDAGVRCPKDKSGDHALRWAEGDWYCWRCFSTLRLGVWYAPPASGCDIPDCDHRRSNRGYDMRPIYDVPGDCEACDGWHADGDCHPRWLGSESDADGAHIDG